MTVLSANSIRKIQPVSPFCERTVFNGMSYGLSHCGYDIRIEEGGYFYPGETTLVSSIEEFHLPKNVVGVVHDKSTWAREGLQVQNTVIEPGWKGFLTLELTYVPCWDSEEKLFIKDGSPIAQILFHWIDEEVEGYTGKYQNQEAGPQAARYE